MAGLRLLLVDEYGKEHTLSDNVYTGSEQPTNADVKLWIDTSNNPPAVKYYNPGQNSWTALNESGSITVSSVSNIPTTSKLVIVQLSMDGSLSVGDYHQVGGLPYRSDMEPGQEIHLIISGSGNITIPNDSEYINLTGEDVISVSDGSYVEINIISDGNKKYIRSIS